MIGEREVAQSCPTVSNPMAAVVKMGNTCKPMAVSFQCMTKFTTKKKKIGNSHKMPGTQNNSQTELAR